MQRFCFALLGLLFFILFACSAPGDDAGMVARTFFEALVQHDYNKAAQYATKDSKTLLDLVKSMEEMGNEMNFFDIGQGESLSEKVVFDDAVVEGDKAYVKITVAGKVSQSVKLIKEEGQWKVALDKDTLKETMAGETGLPAQEKDQSADEAMGEVKNDSTGSHPDTLR